MAEQLMTPMDVARKLRISRATFYRFRGKLIAAGLKMIVVGEYKKYLESSLDRLIQKSAEEGRPLITL